MEILIVARAAFFAALLTLFSGFGLGTLLMPVVALFVSLELAVFITAVVHLANNVFKLGLMWRHTDLKVLFKFGVPALLASILGAQLLFRLGEIESFAHYHILGFALDLNVLNIALGVLIIFFVLIEYWPLLGRLQFMQRNLPLGGVMSGFLGGLSGHQGALRSLFLANSGLSKRAFVATGAVLASLVDVPRIIIYLSHFRSPLWHIDWSLIAAACFAAFAGSYLGAKVLTKVTLRSVRNLVSLLMLCIGVALILGLL